MVSFMTLQNSMDERKLKNYQAIYHTLLSSMTGPVCEVSGGWGCQLMREGETERDF